MANEADKNILNILGINPSRVTGFNIQFKAGMPPMLSLERAITSDEIGKIQRELFCLAPKPVKEVVDGETTRKA